MKQKIEKLLIAILIVSVMISVQDLRGQAIEINSFAGWQFGGTARLYDGDFRIQDAMNYGGKIAVGMSSTTYAEISYMRADTEGRFYPIFGTVSEVVPFSSNYIHVAGLQEVHFGPVAPFTTIGLGLAVWSPKTAQLNSKTQFSATLGAGLKIWLTDFLGIRLQGSMLMPMVFNGFGFGCGIGTGGSSCGSSVYTRITPFQGEFSGGIILKLTPN
ncbi:MAG: hypothetical protein ABFS10_00295 [Bacteroidota bacterium]